MATVAPASRQTLAAARSSGMPVGALHAVWWSKYRQWYLAESSENGSRSRPGPGQNSGDVGGAVKTRAAAVSSTAGDSKDPQHTLIRTQAGVTYPHAFYSGIQGRVGGLNGAGIPHTVLRGIEAQQVGNPIKPAGQIYVKECLHSAGVSGSPTSLGLENAVGYASIIGPHELFPNFLVLCLMCPWSRRHIYQAITQCAQLSRQLRHGVSSNHHRQARRQNPFFFFPRAFLRLHCENPVEGMGEPYAEAAVGRRLQRPGWEATGQDGEFPTGVGQQLRQVRHGFIAVDFSCKWELKQGGRVCPLGCDCEQCRPSRDPGRLCSRPEVGRHGGCPLPGEQAQEACSLVAKASAYLNADDNQAAAARTC